ncbi:MAG: Clp protease N-terminal domain-containing protein [Candidatus Omnitrophota bacterium]
MTKTKILLVSSRKAIAGDLIREWSLKEDIVYRIGRVNQPEENITSAKFGIDSKPSQCIDLSFDAAISRQHAEIWFEEGAWRIKDKSTYGARINKTTILKGEAIELKLDDEITIGNETTLVVISQNRIARRCGNFWVEAEIPDALNCALLHNGLPFIEKIVLRYSGNDKTPVSKLNLKLEDYFDETYEIPVLSAGEKFILKPQIKIGLKKFESQSESSKSFLKIYMEESPVIEKEIKILAYNEWSKEENSYHRASLASFVLPNHPYVEQVIAEVTASKDIPQFPESLYEYFRKKWEISYINEQLSFESISQQIRLPHHVLSNWNDRKGSGTCIDLALLFAACLEKMAFKPLLFIFEIKTGLWHVTLGWRGIGHAISSEIIINDKSRIKECVISMIDPVGFTQGLTLLEASSRAADIFKNNKFIYGIDVNAARGYNILPLPFCGQPKESPALIQVDRKAKELAQYIGKDTGYKVYSPTHILLALLMAGDGFAREVFKKCSLDIEKSKTILKKGLENVKPQNKTDVLAPSRHYESVWLLAQNLAKKEGSPFVFEKHLFFALLETESDALAKAINSLKVDKASLLKYAYSALKDKPFFEGEKSFFSSSQTVTP